MHIYINICIYINREREREIYMCTYTKAGRNWTGFRVRPNMAGTSVRAGGWANGHSVGRANGRSVAWVGGWTRLSLMQQKCNKSSFHFSSYLLQNSALVGWMAACGRSITSQSSV